MVIVQRPLVEYAVIRVISGTYETMVQLDCVSHAVTWWLHMNTLSSENYSIVVLPNLLITSIAGLVTLLHEYKKRAESGILP